MARRSYEDQIRQLEAKIRNIQERAERKKAKANPAVRHLTKALKALDQALNSTDDAVLRKPLDDARATVSSCLGLLGVTPKAAQAGRASRRGSGAARPDAEAVLEHVQAHPGQNSEQITAALGSNAAALRVVMQSLIDDGRVTTQGQRRGRRYFPAKERGGKSAR